MDVAIKIEVERLSHTLDLRLKEIDQNVFTASSKITENALLRAQFDQLYEKQK
jgi:hypothetical protein